MSATSNQVASRDTASRLPLFAQQFLQRDDAFWCCFWGAALGASVPFLVPYFRTLWRQELYQYFPFVFIAVGFLFYTRWDRICRPVAGWFGHALISGGILLLIVGALIHSTWLGNLAFVLMASSFLWSQREPAGSSLGVLALPMIMLVRIPQLHAQSLIVRLQKWTTQVSGLVLDFLAIPNITSGTNIRLTSKSLLVAEACSGIQSAFTLCFVALIILVWRRRPLIVAPLYVLAALFFAVIANMSRVITIALAEAWYQVDWSTGFTHTLIGFVALGIGGGLLFSFDAFASLLLHPVEVPVSDRGANPFAVGWNFLLGFKQGAYEEVDYHWSSANVTTDSTTEDPTPPSRRRPLAVGLATLALLAGFVMVGGIVFGRADDRPIISKEALLFDPPEDLLQGRLGVLAINGHEIRRNGDDPLLGLHADLWSCGADGRASQLMLSQPYVGWHELCVCYEVQEWKLLERYNLEMGDRPAVAVGEFTKDPEYYGYLIFTAIDTDGSVPVPPSYSLFGRLLAPFGPLVTDDFAETSGSAQTLMMQLWTVSREPLEQAELRDLAESLAQARSLAAEQIVRQQHTPTGSGD